MLKNNKGRKIDSSILKKLERKESRRKENTRTTRKTYLIISEGEKTEKYYFNSFNQDLPRNTIFLDVRGRGDNTENLVQYTIKLKEKGYIQNGERMDYDEVWVLLDKDDFPHFDSAIEIAGKENIEVAYSNPCFELWYLLHFNYTDSTVSKNQCEKTISENLNLKYKHNTLGIYELLKNKMTIAIRHSQKLDTMNKGLNPSIRNPCTKVYILVEKLINHLIL